MRLFLATEGDTVGTCVRSDTFSFDTNEPIFTETFSQVCQQFGVITF